MTTTTTTIPTTKTPQNSWIDSLLPFVLGGISGMAATSVTQPIDTVKVRIQIKGEDGAKNVSPFAVAREIRQQQGIKGFYQGLDSALFRQATYATARFGIYRSISNYIKEKNKRDLSGGEKIVSSLTAGFLASLIGNPGDLALVRFQSDGSLPVDQRRNYRHVFDAFNRIIKEEGFLTLWRGAGPNVGRGMAMNLGMLAPYDEVKERINKATGTKDTNSTRLIASAIAGLTAAFAGLPFDNVKTKLQKMRMNAEGVYPYKGFVDCFAKSVAREGVTGLWIGFPTFYFRVAPHAMLALLILDYLNIVVGEYRNKH